MMGWRDAISASRKNNQNRPVILTDDDQILITESIYRYIIQFLSDHDIIIIPVLRILRLNVQIEKTPAMGKKYNLLRIIQI